MQNRSIFILLIFVMFLLLVISSYYIYYNYFSDSSSHQENNVLLQKIAFNVVPSEDKFSIIWKDYCADDPVNLVEKGLKCAKDKNEAREQLDSLLQQKQENIKSKLSLTEREDEKYFNFIVVRETNNEKYKASYRFDKCSYLDVNNFRGPILSKQELTNMGILNKRPIDMTTVTELVEYLNWGSENRILSKNIKEENSDYKVTLEVVTRKTVGIDWDACDKLELYENIYYINKNSGDIKTSSSLKDEFLDKCNKQEIGA